MTHSYPPIPEVPREPKVQPREPKVGEVWEAEAGNPRLVLELFSSSMRVMAPGARAVFNTPGSNLVRPWPSDKRHGFEALIDGILKTHGGEG